MTSADPRDEQWTILKVLNWTVERFRREELESPRLDAEVLLADTLAMERIRLYVEHERPLGGGELSRFRQKVKRRLAGEPVAYITGHREFWSIRLGVDPRVLIPRPETELLVEVGLALLGEQANPTVVDIGTGSGAIIIALGRERPAAVLHGTDLERGALEVARQNAERHGVAVALHRGDLLEPLPAGTRSDLLLSNPPYIPSAEIDELIRDVRDYEPRAALDGGESGLEIYRRLIEQAPSHLTPSGQLALEIGSAQRVAVMDLLERAGYREIRAHQDLAGLDRVISARGPG